jgi:hypothetical protein
VHRVSGVRIVHGLPNDGRCELTFRGDRLLDLGGHFFQRGRESADGGSSLTSKSSGGTVPGSRGV